MSEPSITGLSGVPLSLEPLVRKDFVSDAEVRWCPGCGDYAVLAAFQGLLPELGIRRENTVIVSGIGCSSRVPVLPGHLRDALDPRPGAGDRHRDRHDPSGSCGLGWSLATGTP